MGSITLAVAPPGGYTQQYPNIKAVQLLHNTNRPLAVPLALLLLFAGCLLMFLNSERNHRPDRNSELS